MGDTQEMSKKILNVWDSSEQQKNYYSVGEPIYSNGDWHIYNHWVGYLYAYKDIAVNLLEGLNKDHLDRLANNNRPDGEYSPQHFLYDRAMETLKRSSKLS
jgi:hypothetical protein